MIETIQALLTAFLGLAWDKFTPMIAEYARDTGLGVDENQVKICFGIVVLLFWTVGSVLIRNGFERIRPLRRAMNPTEVMCEDIWLQNVALAIRPYSVAWVEYSARRKRWRYAGVAFGPEFRPAARWDCLSLGMDEERSQWHFAGDAYLLTYNPATRGYDQGAAGRVVPIISVPSDTSYPGNLDARSTDLDVDNQGAVFNIRMTRAGDLFADKRPSGDDLKNMEPSKLRAYFEQKHLITKLPATGVTT